MKKRGFTLAEVMITVLIIGVVAAIILPTVMTKIGDITLENQRKKAQNVLSNGAKMLISQSGSTNLKDTDLKRCGSDSNCIAGEVKKAFKVIGDNTSSDSIYNEDYTFKDPISAKVWQDAGMNYVFATADGMLFGIYKNNKSYSTLTVYGDVNGGQSPNEGGRDFCVYTIGDTGSLAENCEPIFNPPYACSPRNLSYCNQEECNALGCEWVDGSCQVLEMEEAAEEEAEMEEARK